MLQKINTVILFFLISLLGCSKEEYKSPYLNYQTKTDLELPFEGEWYVAAGGRTIKQNHHFGNREEKFAMDIIQQVDGKSFAGNGKQNEDYYCFGKTVNAPGSGKIVFMENNVYDNVPGELNRKQPNGNYVIIDHENGEYSILAHFKKSSIIVQKGDYVNKGQELGKIGNSGIEINLNFIPIQSKNYTLSININTSKTFNSLKTDFVANPTWRLATSGNYFLKDYPMSSLWAFDFTGIDPTNGYPTFNLDVAEGKDPVTDPTSFMKYVGKLNPDLTAGLGLNFRYKMFTLSTSLYLQLGGHKFLAPVYVAPNSTRTISLPLEYDNLTKEITERWTPTNTTASFPGLPDSRLSQIILPDGTYTNYYEMYNYSTARVANASTLRVNSISISYSLPNNIVSRLKCQGINVGFTAANPFAWVSRDFKGIDAEVATGSQPRTRSYTFNLSVNF